MLFAREHGESKETWRAGEWNGFSFLTSQNKIKKSLEPQMLINTHDMASGQK